MKLINLYKDLISDINVVWNIYGYKSNLFMEKYVYNRASDTWIENSSNKC